jgi:hypothetical protein
VRGAPREDPPLTSFGYARGGHVLVNGSPAKPLTKVRAGDLVEARIADRERVFERRHLLLRDLHAQHAGELAAKVRHPAFEPVAAMSGDHLRHGANDAGAIRAPAARGRAYEVGTTTAGTSAFSTVSRIATVPARPELGG